MLNKEQIKEIIPQREPFLMIDEVEEYVRPIEDNVAFYNREMEIYNKVTDMFCDIGDMLVTL